MKKPKTNPADAASRCLIETIVGLEFVVRRELETRFPQASVVRTGKGEIEVQTPNPESLLHVRTAQAVYAIERFAISRPKALLGNEHFRRLSQKAAQITARDSFHTLHIAAAGADSPTMMRIKQELSTALGLHISNFGGDLWIRIRPTSDRTGWETLIRLTPRPLTTRAWRIHDMEGALNATAAQAMAQLSQPQATDSVLNIGCGSGTLLIERAVSASTILVGIDTDAHALKLAQKHVQVSGVIGVELAQADARALSFDAGVFNVLLADLPFGQRIGTHENNVALYPALLNEAARVAQRAACFVCITHELKLMDRLLRDHKGWRLEARHQIVLRGLHPCIYVLRRA